MGLLESVLRWGKAKDSAAKPKEFRLLYGWASPKVANLLNTPYVYAFTISTIAPEAQSRGLRSGRKMRRIVLSELVRPDSLGGFDSANQIRLDIWDEIIPSQNRPATHRIELGILRKKSGIPRSAFFGDYFCFTPIGNQKSSDRVAIQIAGFLARQLEEAQVFDGAAIGDNRTYWLMCIFAAWKEFGR
jgi:hypothetical protein